ncbi:hypothetical protein DYB28_003385 [Aphanomyces astaci]|uniref:Uncharacterized protein n=1 Tax=Aphanomyces astaci TaxID=112090 RepID=A0A9X8DJQ4_APHAT|nr:hypothetical protein DYB28_003385 [Aphanomyces astaci]
MIPLCPWDQSVSNPFLPDQQQPDPRTSTNATRRSRRTANVVPEKLKAPPTYLRRLHAGIGIDGWSSFEETPATEAREIYRQQQCKEALEYLQECYQRELDLARSMTGSEANESLHDEKFAATWETRMLRSQENLELTWEKERSLLLQDKEALLLALKNQHTDELQRVSTEAVHTIECILAERLRLQEEQLRETDRQRERFEQLWGDGRRQLQESEQRMLVACEALNGAQAGLQESDARGSLLQEQLLQVHTRKADSDQDPSGLPMRHPLLPAKAPLRREDSYAMRGHSSQNAPGDNGDRPSRSAYADARKYEPKLKRVDSALPLEHLLKKFDALQMD